MKYEEVFLRASDSMTMRVPHSGGVGISTFRAGRIGAWTPGRRSSPIGPSAADDGSMSVRPGTSWATRAVCDSRATPRITEVVDVDRREARWV